MDVNWEKLAQIRELQEYFEADYDDFKERIEQRIEELAALDPQELDKMAVIRVLEVTNGCIQWAFRRQDEQCLSIEQTRECMQVVIGFIKEKRIDLPNGETIRFTPEVEELLGQIRDLYQQAFKKNVDTAQREFYAYSAAQFLAFGQQRMQRAMDLVQQQFEPLFSDYYLQRGRRYIAPYVEAAPA
ncbi:hypothetical protein C7271_08425 [filamentous cyanobacterium CCP5]|nr:hypothetical protein C7271_08425 [filamentous cyanobacterium CCP5]